jgi:hypothetical protein
MNEKFRQFMKKLKISKNKILEIDWDMRNTNKTFGARGKTYKTLQQMDKALEKWE